MKRLFSFVSFAAVALVAACSSRPVSQVDRDADTAARVGGRVITTRELDEHWRDTDPGGHDQALQALYKGRRAALDDIVATTLIAEAAKARNVDAEAFTETEIARLVAPVTAADVAAFYEKNTRQMQGRSLEQMTPAIESYLTDQRRATARRELIADLRKTGAKVQTLFAPPRREIAVDRSDPSAGNPSAPVTIVEFSDFQCPFCQRLSPTLKQVLDKYGDNVQVVWKDFPLTQIHPSAFKAAEAARCAGEQGKYWDYHDQLFARQQSLQANDLKTYASVLGLDTTKFDACLDSSRHADRVRTGIAEGTQLGIDSTPTVYINGRRLAGAQPFHVLASVIDEELSRN